MPAKAEIRPTIENIQTAAPRVFYEGDINEETSSYSLHINAPLFGELLQEEFGMTPQQIDKLDIVVVGRGGRARTHGAFDASREKLLTKLPELVIPVGGNVSPTKDTSGRRRITIYSETYYKSLIRLRGSLLRSSRKDWKEFGRLGKTIKSANNWLASYYARGFTKEFLVTKRFLPYLKQAGPGRAEKFLERLAPRVMRRAFLKILAHEGKHVADIEKERHVLLKKLGTVTGALITLDLGVKALFSALEGKEPGNKYACVSLPLSVAVTRWIITYLPPASERAAKLAERAVKKKYRWLNCVKFQINEKQDL